MFELLGMEMGTLPTQRRRSRIRLYVTATEASDESIASSVEARTAAATLWWFPPIAEMVCATAASSRGAVLAV